MRITIGLMVISFVLLLFLLLGALIGTQYANDQIADLHEQVDAYQLSYAVMEQHIEARDARAEEQRILIDVLIDENAELWRWKDAAQNMD